MRQKLSRGLATVGILATLAIGMVGCGQKRECDMCGKEASCSKESFMGEEVYVCKDCKKSLKALNSLGSLFS